MEPLTDLIKGIGILMPFLERYGFEFDKYENAKSSGGQFTIVIYIKEDKKSIIGYRYSIGEVDYQFDKFKVGHLFYLNHLGLTDKKQFPCFQSDDKFLVFRHILHDLYFLVDDFFVGSCSKLIEASKSQDIFVADHNKKAQLDYDNHFDKIKIEKARLKFKEKESLLTD